MPTYVFEDDLGHQIEMTYSVNECPRTVTVGGSIYKKIIAGVQFSIPAHMKAGAFEDAAARRRQFSNNEKIATQVAAGQADIIPNDQPSEFRADLDSRIAKKLGKTRLG